MATKGLNPEQIYSYFQNLATQDSDESDVENIGDILTEEGIPNLEILQDDSDEENSLEATHREKTRKKDTRLQPIHSIATRGTCFFHTQA